MSKRSRPSADSRRTPRYKMPAMYTLVRVRPKGSERFCWTGYIYDISTSGMRLELDKALAAGTQVDVRAMLPGNPHTTFDAAGHVVRCHDDADDVGPVRMGLNFDKFPHANDRRQLENYLSNFQSIAA